MSSITDVYSPRTTFRCTRLRGAKVGSSVCQFCAVGCSQLGFFKDGKLIDVEGDPRSAVNEGRLCPKGSSTYALNDNPYRKVKPMYRAPGSDHWEEVTLDWMLDTVAKRIWDTRNKGFARKILQPASPSITAPISALSADRQTTMKSVISLENFSPAV